MANIGPAGTESATKYRIWAAAAIFCIASALEVLSYIGFAPASFAASRIWLGGAGFTAVYILYRFIRIGIEDIRKRDFLPPAGMLALIGVLLFLAGNLDFGEINPDAAQQLAAGLDSFSRTDLNYTAKQFLGYSARQYVLGALPAFLGGRSIGTLHLGFALPFIAGLISLYNGLRCRARASGTSPLIPLIAVYAVFLFPFIAEYYLIFEQAIYPVALTMAAIGLLLGFLSDGSIAAMAALTWTACLMSNSYTPAVASLALLLAVQMLMLLALAFQKSPAFPPRLSRGQTGALLGISASTGIIFFAATLIGKRGDRLLQISDSSGGIPAAMLQAFGSFTDKEAVFFGMAGIFVILYMIAGISLRLKPRDLLISVWVLCTFAAAFLLRGYTVYRSEWLLQRAMVVVPVLVAGMALTVFDRLAASAAVIRTRTAAILLAALCLAGFSNFARINQSFTYFNQVQPMKYMIADLEDITRRGIIARDEKFYLILYTDNILLKNPGDYMKFFYPSAVCIVPQGKEYPQDLPSEYTVIIYSIRYPAGIPQAGQPVSLTYNNFKRRETNRLYRYIIDSGDAAD